MELNLPSEIRKIIYTVWAVGTPTMAFLFEQGVVNKLWFGLFSVVAGAFFGLARINVSNK